MAGAGEWRQRLPRPQLRGRPEPRRPALPLPAAGLTPCPSAPRAGVGEGARLAGLGGALRP